MISISVTRSSIEYRRHASGDTATETFHDNRFRKSTSPDFARAEALPLDLVRRCQGRRRGSRRGPLPRKGFDLRNAATGTPTIEETPFSRVFPRTDTSVASVERIIRARSSGSEFKASAGLDERRCAVIETRLLRRRNSFAEPGKRDPPGMPLTP